MSTVVASRHSSLSILRPVNVPPVAVAGLLVAAGVVYLSAAVTWRQGALFLVGTMAGIVLYHAAFGFTSSWRAMIAEKRGEGLRAQMVMLALTCVVFVPLISMGHVFGQPVRGSVSPFGMSVAVGAFLFGVGMQLGGGCASGTLYTAGGGNPRMLVTLAAFIAGSVLGVLHMPTWEQAPTLGSVSFMQTFGSGGSLLVSLILFGAVALVSFNVERRTHGLRVPFLSWRDNDSWLRGPWPVVAGAIGLAVVNIATLGIAGRPWGVTSAFALWGSKMLAAVGVDVASWPYWRSAARAAELNGSLLNDVTTVMNVGIMLGALIAAGLAGRFAPSWRVPLRSLLAAVVGGLLLGYGARIAYGCNIGAYFSGIASTSLHGWLWFAAAFLGNTVGTRLRPAFGLKV
ncbi:MAG: YeeE/YedE family protein [Acidimicrobiia bacterium]|nr:YeeE/YedE family protein [Acidimicrobiia bacterium]